jgi:hypothetical protein
MKETKKDLSIALLRFCYFFTQFSKKLNISSSFLIVTVLLIDPAHLLWYAMHVS